MNGSPEAVTPDTLYADMRRTRPWASRAESLGQFRALHQGHDDIGEQQMHRLLLSHAQRLLRI